jgi:hypothetical protein
MTSRGLISAGAYVYLRPLTQISKVYPACQVASMSLQPLDPSGGASYFSFVLLRETATYAPIAHSSVANRTRSLSHSKSRSLRPAYSQHVAEVLT